MTTPEGRTTKVLVLTSTFPRWKNDTEPGFVYELSSRLNKHHEITVLAPHYPGSKRHEEFEGVETHRFKYFISKYQKLAYCGGILPNLKKNKLLLFQVPFFLLFELIACIKLLKEKDAELIHAHWIIPQGLVAVIAKKITGSQAKIILTSHGADLFSLTSPILKHVKVYLLKNVDVVTVVSQYMKEKAEELGAKNVLVRPMGVDLLGKFTPPAPNTKRNGIIFVGRLVEKKGVEYLIKAIPTVLNAHPDTHLNIIGSGPLLGDLQTLTQQLSLEDNITFLGAIPNHQVPTHLQKALISVVPSIVADSGDQEGLGLTIAESMGCECITLASEHESIRDLLMDQETGISVLPKDSIDIAKKLVDALHSPKNLDPLIKKGRKHVLALLDWSQVTNDHSEIYKSHQA